MKESAPPGLPVIRSPESPSCPRCPKPSISGGRLPTTPRQSVPSTAAPGASSSNSPKRSASPPGSYDLRSHQGGIAVSSEAPLHADRLYVQASQSAMGHDYGILIRICQGRKDYHGGPNNFASLDLLNRPEELARRINDVC